MISDDRAERLRQAILAKKAKKAQSSPRPSGLLPRPVGEPAHLGELQRSLWLAHQLAPRSPAYHLASGFRLQGELDFARLQLAFNQVVARHRLLRSTFRAEAGSVLQVEHPPTRQVLDRIRGGEGGNLAAAIEQARQPFDLTAGPLIRLLLVETPPEGQAQVEEEAQGEVEARGEVEALRERPLLVLVLHHILADERSLGFLWQELAVAYNAEPTTRESPQGSDDLQYDDFVHDQRQRGERALSGEVDFWRRRLDPFPQSLRLPFERPLPEQYSTGALFKGAQATGGKSSRAELVGDFQGRLSRQTVSQAVKEGIRQLAADTGTTPFAVYAFAFRLQLHRYTEGRPIAFATPVSTRSQVATSRMVGYFSNPVVISAPIDEEIEVATSIREFSAEVREALAHASVPFQKLVEELSPPRDPGRHPIFQTMFVYQQQQAPPQLGAVRLDPVVLDLGAAKFDLTLFVADGEGDGEVAVEYRVDRFEPIWMEALLGHYQNLLEALPVKSARAATEVSMLGPQEQRWLIAQSRGPESSSPEAPCLPQQIFDHMSLSPESPAVVCGGSRWSYGELGCFSAEISRQLVAAGVGSGASVGERVGLFLGRSVWLIAGIVGCHRAGAAYVPLDPSFPEERNRLVLEDAAVAAVLTTTALRRRLPAGPWLVIQVDSLGEEVSLGDSPDLPPEALAYLLYTSGSTGRPKGVVVSHENLRVSTEARFQVYDAAPERFLLLPSIAFDSSVAGIFWTLAAAKTLVIPTDEDARDPRRLARLVAEEGVTGLLCVPSLYGEMLRSGSELLEGLETVIVAGEACSSQLVETHFRALPMVRLFNEYGPTEGTVWATFHEMTCLDSSRPVAIGRPIPGVRVEVLDSQEKATPAGIPGQLWIEGPTVAQGYWRNPDLTQERFRGGAGEEAEPETGAEVGAGDRSRRFRTGDRAVWTPDGRLLFLGRQDEQIKLRGFRIEPGEVEAALVQSPTIEQAAVVARPLGDGQGSEGVGQRREAAASSREIRLVAFVRLTDAASEEPFDPSKVRQKLAKLLPAHMIPNRLVPLPELPVLPNGKVDREHLRRLPLEGRVKSFPSGRGGLGEGDSPASLLEEGLISLWEGLLGQTGLSVKDNFFTLGGHSLLVVEMAQAIEQDFEGVLSANEIFENPTVEELARYLEQKAERPGGTQGPAYEHLFPIQPSGEGIPFIVAVPHFFSAMLATRFRGERPVYGLRGVSLRPEGNRGRWPTMKDLGQDLVEEIHRRFPNQRVILAGYSFGASMAVETVRLMEQRGLSVHSLYLIAPMPMDLYRFGPFRVPVGSLPESGKDLPGWQALRLFAAANSPLTRPLYARLRHWLTVEPWRRLLCLVGQLRGWVGLGLTPRILNADVRLERFRLHSRYRPGGIRTPTIIFNAQETETDAAASWQPFFEGPFTVHSTPDPHLGEASAEAARQVILHHLKDLEEL